MTRKTGPTEEVTKAICEAIEVGLGLADSFMKSGIGARTGYVWKERGRLGREALQADADAPVAPEDMRYVEFFDKLEAARLGAKERLLTIVSNDAVDNAESAKWLLMKKWPREFGDRVQVTIDAELEGFLEDCERELEPEVFQRLLVIAARRVSSEEAVRAHPLDRSATADPG